MPICSSKRGLILGTLMGTVLAISSTTIANADETRSVEVWKDPYCGCCGKWVDQMQAAGFDVRVHNVNNLNAIKSRHGVPQRLRSCHTAKVGRYVVEGHVPIADVKRLLESGAQIVGISVPGMPIGSPGMEAPSGETEPYEVLTFDTQGRTTVFAKHN